MIGLLDYSIIFRTGQHFQKIKNDNCISNYFDTDQDFQKDQLVCAIFPKDQESTCLCKQDNFACIFNSNQDFQKINLSVQCKPLSSWQLSTANLEQGLGFPETTYDPANTNTKVYLHVCMHMCKYMCNCLQMKYLCKNSCMFKTGLG